MAEQTELSKDVQIRSLYEVHLKKEMLNPVVEPLQEISEMNNSIRIQMKTLLFNLIYREASRYPNEILLDYYATILMYFCIEVDTVEPTPNFSEISIRICYHISWIQR